MRVKFALLIFFFYSCTAIPAEFEYQIKTVKYKNLAAKLYLPKSDQNVPVVIAFGGSEGGFNSGDANGEMIAPHTAFQATLELRRQRKNSVGLRCAARPQASPPDRVCSTIASARGFESWAM